MYTVSDASLKSITTDLQHHCPTTHFRNLTLEQVAGTASLSKSYLSQMENDNCNPSLNSLRAVMDVYGLPLAAQFEHPEMQPPVAVVRKSKRKTYTLPDSVFRREFLTPDTRRKMEAVLTVAGVGESSAAAFAYEGEEC